MVRADHSDRRSCSLAHLTSLHAKEVPPHKPSPQHKATPTRPTPPSIHWSPTTIDTRRWRAAARLVEQECETLAMTHLDGEAPAGPPAGTGSATRTRNHPQPRPTPPSR